MKADWVMIMIEVSLMEVAICSLEKKVIRVPLAGGGTFEGDFFEVEYNIRNQNKNLFAKVVIKDIPRKIVLTALKYRGSKKWEYDTEKTSTRRVKRTVWTNDSRAGLFMGKAEILIAVSKGAFFRPLAI